MQRHPLIRLPRGRRRQPTMRGEPEAQPASLPAPVLRSLAGGRPALDRLPTVALQRAAVMALGQRAGNAAIQRLLAPPKLADITRRRTEKARRLKDQIDAAKQQQKTLRQLLKQKKEVLEKLRKQRAAAESGYAQDNVEGLLVPIVGELLGEVRTTEDDAREAAREIRDLLRQVTKKRSRLERKQSKVIGSLLS